MKAFFASIIAVVVIALGSDYLLGGPILDSGGVLVDPSAAAANVSANVRLPTKEEKEAVRERTRDTLAN